MDDEHNQFEQLKEEIKVLRDEITTLKQDINRKESEMQKKFEKAIKEAIDKRDEKMMRTLRGHL